MKKSNRLAPRGLSAEAKKLWRELVEEYAIADAGGLQILRVGLEAFDRMRECQRAIAKNGSTVVDRWGQVKAHPLLPSERDSRAQYLAAIKALNLDLEPLKNSGRAGRD